MKVSYLSSILVLHYCVKTTVSLNLICVQMAGLCWMTVALVFFLSAGDSVTAVNRDDLAKIVKFMVDR